ncbi:hypothetical protein HK098_003596 [Nowakowskiella sp. JEL0407]|nr:hypothetical protein HK098_003596 [Nowakowskiella sp. JEL0407]
MEDELQRWRSIASQSIYTHPSQHVAFVPLKRKQTLSKNRENFATSPDVKLRPKTSDAVKKLMEVAERYKEIKPSKKIVLPKRTEQKNPSTGPNDFDTIPDIHDVLEQFDSVKLARNISPIPITSGKTHDKHENYKTIPAEPRKFIPALPLNFTKNDEYKIRRKIAEKIVDNEWNYKISRVSKVDRLEEIKSALRKELEQLPPSTETPDMKRLSAYSTCFSEIIGTFNNYKPILSEIKAEYDAIISSFQNDQTELQFLRTKVQKLLSQNENRLLLRYERSKSKDLESKVEKLQSENEQLKAELKRKLLIYAGYLPPSVLHEKRKEEPSIIKNLMPEMYSSYFFPVLATAEFKFHPTGEDPISIYERQIGILENEINTRKLVIGDLKRKMEDQYVPKELKEKLEEKLAEAENKLYSLTEKYREVESQIAKQREENKKLSENLAKSEEEYGFLLKEYNELCEAVAVNYDDNIMTTTMSTVDSANKPNETSNSSEENAEKIAPKEKSLA